MNRRLVRWGLFFALIAGFLSAPIDASAQTLEDAMVSAYLANPQLKADHARQHGLDEDVARAWGGWKPTVTLSGEAGRGRTELWYNYLDPPSNVKEGINPKSISLQLSQPIYDGGRAAADVTKAKSAVTGGRAHSISVEQSVLGDAVQNYYDLYRDQQIVELDKANIAWLEDEVKATHARFRVKDVTMTDVAQSDERFARGTADRVAAEGTVAADTASFLRATGVTAVHLAPPPPLPDGLLPVTLDEALALAPESPPVKEAVEAINQAKADVDYVASALKPNLSLQVSAQYSSETSQGQFAQRYEEVLGNLSVPLYEGGVFYARVREAKEVVIQREFEAEQARLQAMERVRRGWDQLQAARSRITLISGQVKSAEVAVDNVKAEVKVGSRTVSDLLNAEQELVESEIVLEQAKHDAAVASFSLLASTGRLTAKDLHLPVTIYDPQKNYDAEAGRWIGFGISHDDEPTPLPQ